MTTEEKFEGAIAYIRSEINDELPMQHLAILLKVAAKEGITQHELGGVLGMHSGSISRNIKLLSQWAERNKDGKLVIKGYGLLDTRPDIEERRRMSVWLTPKGKQILQDVYSILETGKIQTKK